MCRMPLRAKQDLLLPLIFASLMLLAACSGGGNRAAPAGGAASASIGPTGGQLSSSDGRLTLTIPAGALATTELITVSRLETNDLPLNLQDLAPDEVWRIEPAGLTFAQPVQFSLDVVSPEMAEEVATEVLTAPLHVVFASEPETPVLSLKSIIDAATQQLKVNADLMKTGELIVKSGLYGQVSVSAPVTIPVGSTVPFTATITNMGGIPNAAEWQAISSFVTDDLSDTFVPFTGSFNVSCPGMPTTGIVRLSVRYNSLVTLNPTVFTASVQSAEVEFVLPLACFEPLVTDIPEGVVSLVGVLKDVENVQVFDTDSAFLPPGHPPGLPILVAAGGLESGNGPGAAIIDPTGTQAPVQIPIGGPGTAFDAHLIPSPGGSREALFTSGIDGFLIEVFPGPNLAQGGLLTMGFHEDTSEIAMDPANGVVAARSITAIVASIDDTNGSQLQSFNFSQQLRSVAMNATRTRALVIRANSNDLAHAVLDPMTSTVVSETSVRTLGTTPRRIRWNPNSGLVGISDFSDNSVTALYWDGNGSPTFIGTANVGQGPVGIDVFDNQILSVGFNDDTWSRVDVDMSLLTIDSVTTNPIPFAPINGQSFSPGHIKALGDVDKSVVISNFGDQSVTFLNNAYQ